MRSSLKKALPIAVIVAGLFAFFYFHLYRFLSIEKIATHQELLLQWTKEHYVKSVGIYIFLFAAAEAVSVPGSSFFTLAGGFLFGTWLGTAYAVVSATIGSVLLFIAVKFSLAEWFHKKTGKWVQKMEKGFQQNEFYYLLTLRLLPFFPFWLITAIAGLLGMTLMKFAVATFLGIIPGTFIYSSVGHSLGKVLHHHQAANLSLFFEPQILIPLIGLAVLSLIPVLLKALNRSSKKQTVLSEK